MPHIEMLFIESRSVTTGYLAERLIKVAKSDELQAQFFCNQRDLCTDKS